MVVQVCGDCGIPFHLDDVDDGVVGWGGGCGEVSNIEVVIVNECISEFIVMCRVSVDSSGMTDSAIGIT